MSHRRTTPHMVNLPSCRDVVLTHDGTLVWVKPERHRPRQVRSAKAAVRH